jgi:hypothetical protein
LTAPSATDDPGTLPVTPGGCCGGGIGGPQATNAPDAQPIAPGGCCGIN